MLRLASGVRVCERGSEFASEASPRANLVAQTPNLKFKFGPEMEIL